MIRRSCVWRGRLRAVVALSGGVDSATAAAMAVRFGPKVGLDVVGAAHMTNWSIESEVSVPPMTTASNPGSSSSTADRENRALPAVCAAEKQAAADIATELGLRFHHCGFEPEFYTSVFMPMVEAFSGGGSLNPDTECNRLIKFGLFSDHVRRLFDADVVVTGHYARNSRWRMSEALAAFANGATNRADFLASSLPPRTDVSRSSWRGVCRPLAEATNDQSYFLSRVAPLAAVDDHAVFPLSELSKREVRSLCADVFGFSAALAAKPTSTGVCFIGERRFDMLVEEHARANSTGTEDGSSTTESSTNTGLDLFRSGRIRWHEAADEGTASSPLLGELFVHGQGRTDSTTHSSTSSKKQFSARSQVPQSPPLHRGVARYTVGQKLRLRVWPSGAVRSFYVAAKIAAANELSVVESWDHPALFRTCVTARDLLVHDWSRIAVGSQVHVVARHLQTPVSGVVTALNRGATTAETSVEVRLDTRIRTPCEGQVLALYCDESEAADDCAPAPQHMQLQRCVAAGIISG